MIMYSAYIADAIICHNIWLGGPREEETYMSHGLTPLLWHIHPENKLSIRKYPLQFMLCLLDTIEPTKRFCKTHPDDLLKTHPDDLLKMHPYDILNKISIEEKCKDSKGFDIVWNESLETDDGNNGNSFKQWYTGIKNMPEWMDVTCEVKIIPLKYDGTKRGKTMGTLISDKFAAWEAECNQRFNQLKANEEELNRIFIDIYGLQDELTPEVEDKDVTVRRADLTREIKSLLSYAVGCMFGRYSLDVDGLAYAGGKWDDSKYTTFIPDADNVLPITDEEYFTDDIVGRFVEFVKVVYGTDTLEDNLAFIAKALGVKGTSPRAVIRNYFLNGFYADHVKIYQKRPIYWLYDSGKQNGFKALIYMHRYNADTSGLVRADYLYKMEQVYESEIARMDDAIAHGASREVAQATKRKEKLVKQLKECKDYDDRLGHIALARIPIDLDDGVKVNYDKVQTGADGKKQAILAKI